MATASLFTRCALARAAARYARAGRTVLVAWAPEGRDFNDIAPDWDVIRSIIKAAVPAVVPVPAAGGRAAVDAPGETTTQQASDLERRLADFDLTDLGNARRFEARYQNRLLHSHQAGWYQFDGRRWTTEGAEAAVLRAAQDTVDALKREADALENDHPKPRSME